MAKAKGKNSGGNEKLNIRNTGARTRSSTRSAKKATKTIAKSTKFMKNDLINAKHELFGKKLITTENIEVYRQRDVQVNTNTSHEDSKSNRFRRNIVSQFKAMEAGYRFNMFKVWKESFIDNFSTLQPVDFMNPFVRRITAISWNKKNPNFVAVGSKGGELTLINTNSVNGTETFIDGIGPGGSINAIKFDEANPSIIYTACLTGEVLCQDFAGKRNALLLSTGSFENWFCSLDILYEKKMLLSGDCKGRLYCMSTKGEKISSPIKIHSNKVAHIELCSKNTNLMVTSSLDRTVKVWDLRKLYNSNSSEPLVVLPHNNPINSAYFSESNCFSLLTTDQHKELRVYSCNTWELETTILHPHRHFQHLTPIKASWYPLEDIIVVGRFPDDRFITSDLRTIDFYDAHNGELLYRLSSPIIEGISVLNYFNSTGDVLISGNGRNIVFWKNFSDVTSCDPLL